MVLVTVTMLIAMAVAVVMALTVVVVLGMRRKDTTADLTKIPMMMTTGV